MTTPRISESEWTRLLRLAAPMRIAVVGAAGRLGLWLSRVLTDNGHEVLAIDKRTPEALLRQEYVRFELGGNNPLPVGLLRSCDAVVHLAALHGAHLVSGTPRREFWPVNVNGTQSVLDAAIRARVQTFVFASSTSVHGSGSSEGPARVINEQTVIEPEDVYDLTKLAGERLVSSARERGLNAVTLRLGRFFSPGQVEYHLRKLSSGLDIRDACQAIVRALLASKLRTAAYCVASDLCIGDAKRAELGVDAISVLRDVVPNLLTAAAQRGIIIPRRVGKSVSTDLIRTELGYAPERSLDWVARIWASESPTDPSAVRFPRARARRVVTVGDWRNA